MKTKRTRILPNFANEKQEADWWYENREQLDREFIEAAGRGEVKVLTRERLLERLEASKKPSSQLVSIHLPNADVKCARKQAERRGLPYQAYIESLLHEALQREELIDHPRQSDSNR